MFICFAPVEQPRYAAAVVIEHGLGGARAAAPVAKDFLTYLYDPEKAMAALLALEAEWGGDINARMATERAQWKATHALADSPSPRPAVETASNAQAAANEAASNAASTNTTAAEPSKAEGED